MFSYLACPGRLIFQLVFLFSVEASDLECDEIHEDVKATEKDAALQLAVSQIASEFTKESMLSLKKFFGVRRAPVVSTGSLKLDLALGIGGLPKVAIGIIGFGIWK